jgi:hypothetical protein
MEYFEYDYTKVNRDLSFKNYEAFISGRLYKRYLFDLGLLRYDSNMPKTIKDRANDVLFLQKVMTLVPYPLVLARLYYLHRKGFFSVNNFEKEFKTVINLSLFVIAMRCLQKGVLKFQADELLLEASKFKI